MIETDDAQPKDYKMWIAIIDSDLDLTSIARADRFSDFKIVSKFNLKKIADLFKKLTNEKI